MITFDHIRLGLYIGVMCLCVVLLYSQIRAIRQWKREDKNRYGQGYASAMILPPPPPIIPSMSLTQSQLIGRLTEEQMTLSEAEIRKLLKIPKNRYYSTAIYPAAVRGNVWLDLTRERVIACRKLSKSD